MLVVVLLQLVEVGAFGFAGVDVVQSVVAGVIDRIAYVEEGPEDGRDERVVEAHHPPHCEIPYRDYHHEEWRG